MHLISGCTATSSCQYSPSSSMPKLAADNTLQSPCTLATVCWSLWLSSTMVCISLSTIIRCDTCQHNFTDWLSASVVDFTIVNDPTILQPGFIYLVIHGLGLIASRQVKVHVLQTYTDGSLPYLLPVMWPTADHEPHSQNASINNILKRSAITPGWRQCSQLAGDWSDYSLVKYNEHLS